MAALLGLGEQNVCLVHTDKAGRMDPLHLDSEVQRIIATGAAPFMVVATAGTMSALFSECRIQHLHYSQR
jgi:glutamate/tyrosine decarboxylase-like PLP-dependent enzyme